jgi:hypothetical protein
MQYSILSLKRRFEDYETLGALFRETKSRILQNTLVEKIWKFLIDILDTILCGIGVDWELLIQKIIDTNENIEDQIRKCFYWLTPIELKHS